jgi:hypothetical protein
VTDWTVPLEVVCCSDTTGPFHKKNRG